MAEFKKNRYSIQMRRLLAPIILILLVTQSFASTFETLKDQPNALLEDSGSIQNWKTINIPAGTQGGVVGKKKFRNGGWAYEFEVSHVGGEASSSLAEGSRLWFPCQDDQCAGLVEFRNSKNRIVPVPKIDDYFKTKKDMNVRNTVARATPDACATPLDSKNAGMVSNQVECLKKKAIPEKPLGQNIDPLFNEMLYYLNLLKPGQKLTNREVAQYTLEFAKQKGIPPLFLLAICKAESSFNPNAMSTFYSKDKDGNRVIGHAYGVCQLIETTASSHSRHGRVTPTDLKDNRTNLDLATDEIQSLMHIKTIKVPNKSGKVSQHCTRDYCSDVIFAKHPKPIPENAIVTTETPNYLEVLEAYNCGAQCLADIKGGKRAVYRATLNYAKDILHNLDDYTQKFADAHFPTQTNIN